MFARPTNRHVKYLTEAPLVVTLVGILIPTTASARIVANTIDPVAIVTENGRHLVVTGPISCTGGERAYIRVTVTQRSTGAVAEGLTLLHTCTGGSQHWQVHAQTQGKESFEIGAATAVALGRTTTPGITTDAHQWLVNITLKPE